MLSYEMEGKARWAHLPEADPPAHLRETVLASFQSPRGNRAGRSAGTAAGAAVAALFVLAIALPLGLQPPSGVDLTVTMLRAQGVEVFAPPTAAAPAQVQGIATGSAAARVGLRVGDQLLAIDMPQAAGGMLNVAVLRGASARYFALPGGRVGKPGAGDAGMANAPVRVPALGPAPALSATAAGLTTSLVTSLGYRSG